jgi:hypothetical protein
MAVVASCRLIGVDSIVFGLAGEDHFLFQNSHLCRGGASRTLMNPCGFSDVLHRSWPFAMVNIGNDN